MHTSPAVSPAETCIMEKLVLRRGSHPVNTIFSIHVCLKKNLHISRSMQFKPMLSRVKCKENARLKLTKLPFLIGEIWSNRDFHIVQSNF